MPVDFSVVFSGFLFESHVAGVQNACGLLVHTHLLLSHEAQDIKDFLQSVDTHKQKERANKKENTLKLQQHHQQAYALKTWVGGGATCPERIFLLIFNQSIVLMTQKNPETRTCQLQFIIHVVHHRETHTYCFKSFILEVINYYQHIKKST